MVIPGNFDFRKTRIDKGELFGWLFTIYIMIQIVVYILAIIRWFITDHFSFWHGFKELIFALVPIVNFFYISDWIRAAYYFIFALIGLLNQ